MNIEELLDRNRPLNVDLLDKAVQAFYTGDPATQREAERVLTLFQNQPDTWQQVASILETSQSLHTKFLGLRILDNFVTVRWNTVPLETRLEIRNYIVGLVISLTSTPNLDLMERTMVTKLNMVLVQILKKDWLQHWPSFVPEIVAASQTNLSLCENNLRILKLLSEEIFDYSSDQMTVSRTNKLQARMKQEADVVFDLCKQVLGTKDVPPSLMEAALATLCRLLVWLPQELVVLSGIVDVIGPLINKHRILVLECYTTIASQDVPDGDGNYSVQLVKIYDFAMDYIQKALPLIKDFALVYEDSDAYDQSFVHHVLLFITTILSKHLGVLHTHRNSSSTEKMPPFIYLLELSRIEDVEMWRICLEFWENLTHQQDQISSHFTQLHLAELRELILDRMAPPDEVLLVQDDDGEVKKEYIKEGGSSITFKSMKHILSNITRLDTQGTLKIIYDRLISLSRSEHWTWSDLNKLCWAIGSISGTLNGDDENGFLMLVVEELVRMLEKFSSADTATGGGETCYALTSCLAYIGTQYVDFIDRNPLFLKLVLARLFGYMHDPLSDVRDMACDSFMKICQGCPTTLANKNIGDYSASIMWIVLRDLNDYTKDLDTSQMALVYGALGYLVVSLSLSTEQKLAIDELTKTPELYLNRDWNMISQNPVLFSINDLRSLVTAIKLNQAICDSTGPLYQSIFYRDVGFYVDIYKLTSNVIRSPETAEDSLEKRQCQKIKVEIQKLVGKVFSHIADEQGATNIYIHNNHQLQNLLRVIMEDYRALSVSSDPTVLDMMTTILQSIESLLPQALDTILVNLFEPTLMMINQNFSDHPTHRLGFFRLLRSLNQRYFTDLQQLPPNKFVIIVDSILWGTKHTLSDISHVALQTCLEMINFVSQLDDEDTASEFYRAYYLRILTETLTILVDPDCQNGFKYQSQLLARMLELVHEGEIYTQVFDTTTVNDPLMSNTIYLQNYVQQFFKHTFPLLQNDQTEVLVLGMFEYSGDLERFQSDLLDFLIDIRQVDDIDAGNQRQQQQQDAELELLRFV